MIEEKELEELVEQLEKETSDMLKLKETYTEADLEHLSQDIVNWKQEWREFEESKKNGTINEKEILLKTVLLMSKQSLTGSVMADMDKYSHELRSKLNETISRIEMEMK